MLSSHLGLDPPSGLFLHVYPSKSCKHPSIPHNATYPAQLIRHYFITLTILNVKYNTTATPHPPNAQKYFRYISIQSIMSH
jgi:hypothetical protein